MGYCHVAQKSDAVNLSAALCPSHGGQMAGLV